MPVPSPLVRALLPLGLGIWAGDCYPLSGGHTLWWGGLIALLVLLAITYAVERYRLRHPTSLHSSTLRCTSLRSTTHSDVAFIPLAFFLTGATLSTLHRPAGPEASPGSERQSEATYLFELSSSPKERARTYVCRATLRARRAQTDSVARRAESGTYLLYVSKEGFNPSQWAAGQWLVARTTLRPFTQLPDSATFDYPTYARRRGWSGTAYIASGQWQLSRKPQYTELDSWKGKLMHAISSCRQQLINLFRTSTLEGESLGLITALTLGDKELLPAETKATFARTGVSHLLALSGLHVGILYTLLLLPTLPLRRHLRWTRPLFLLLVLMALWGFALLTGLSPSVVRSVTMYSLLTLSILIGTPSMSLDKLVAAAFLLLVVHPYWLFDIGFQLSCTGVASILYLGPALQSLYTTHTRWQLYLWNFFTVSTAAQIGTAPLVACYFGTFSPYFLFANAWSVPLVTLLLYTSLAWITCHGISSLLLLPALHHADGLIHHLFPTLFDNLARLLNKGLHFIEQLPYSCIHVPRPDTIECFISYAILLLIPLRSRQNGRYRYAITIQILFLIWMLACYHYFILR